MLTKNLSLISRPRSSSRWASTSTFHAQCSSSRGSSESWMPTRSQRSMILLTAFASSSSLSQNSWISNPPKLQPVLWFWPSTCTRKIRTRLSSSSIATGSQLSIWTFGASTWHHLQVTPSYSWGHAWMNSSTFWRKRTFSWLNLLFWVTQNEDDYELWHQTFFKIVGLYQ